MSDLSRIDKNFEVGKPISKEGVRFYNVLEEPLKVSGLLYIDGRFCRMDPDIAAKVSDKVQVLNYNTAGGRVRFRTDSPFVMISAKYGSVGRLPHCAMSGSAGFDLYADNVYIKTFMPSWDMPNSLESIINIGEGKMRDITINFPLYSSIDSLYVGLDESATVELPTPYTYEKPVVYYGSSITQGACASRPGTCYQPYICREFNVDYLNLGFSGSAKAEDAIIEYISALDMQLFVYDYDHNAPTVEHLEKTHEKMFLAIRASHPDIPIIMMSRPRCVRSAEEDRRIEIISNTYNRALKSGDRNVYFLDGDALTALCGNGGSVDHCHPTDFGFASMASALIDLIKKEKLL